MPSDMLGFVLPGASDGFRACGLGALVICNAVLVSKNRNFVVSRNGAGGRWWEGGGWGGGGLGQAGGGRGLYLLKQVNPLSLFGTPPNKKDASYTFCGLVDYLGTI